jgi:hypothetical protein
MRYLIVTLLLALSVAGYSQTNEHEAVKQVISNMFTAMRTSDTVLLRSTFAPQMILQSVVNKKDGTTALITEQAHDFIKQVGTPHTEIYDERITIADVKVDGPLASAWVPYKFYVGSAFSHCGVNVFQLMKSTAGWKVIYIVDTRRKGDCVE